jgi:hypothetical protein
MRYAGRTREEEYEARQAIEKRTLKNTTPVSISNRIASPITNNACGRSNGTSGPCKEMVPSLSTVLSSVVVIVILQKCPCTSLEIKAASSSCR